MNSLMFTFSGEQLSKQIPKTIKSHEKTSISFRRRSNSYKNSSFGKNLLNTSQGNQLFETFNFQSSILKNNRYKNEILSNLKAQNLQVNEKSKVRTIIKATISRNQMAQKINLHQKALAQVPNYRKHRKLLSKSRQKSLQRSNFLNQKTKVAHISNAIQCLNDSKLISQQSTIPQSQTNNGRKSFQMRKIQFNHNKNKEHYSHRYHQTHQQQNQQQKENKVNNKIQRKSCQSMRRRSLNKSSLRYGTPKILYPQSQTKLPSVFKQKSAKNSLNNSIQKRHKKISSLGTITQHEKKKTLECGLNQKQFEYLNNQLKTFLHTSSRPKSMKIPSQKCQIQLISRQIPNKSIYNKLQFESIPNLSEEISKKLQSYPTKSTQKCMKINKNFRTHKQIPRQIVEDLFKLNKSNKSRQTAEESYDQLSYQQISYDQLSYQQLSYNQLPYHKQQNQEMNITAGFKQFMNQDHMTCSITLNI